MNLQPNTRSISIHPDEISLSDRTYYLPCYDALGPLVESIRQVGILSPPVVRKNDDGSLAPVVGRRRIEAASKAGISKLSVFVVDASESDENLVNLLFWDNISRIGNSPVTVAAIVTSLLEVFDSETVAQTYLPWIGVPPRGPRLLRLKAVAKLDERSQRALWSGRILEKTASLLSGLNTEDRFELLNFIERYGWNANKSDEMAQAVYDLSILSGESVSKTICEAVQLLETQHEQDDAIRKSEKMRNLIKSLRWKDVSQHQELFNQWQKRLDLPRHIRVKPSISFENDSVSIEITANSLNEAEGIIQKLMISKNC